jgi:hypothetical protein
VLQPLLKKWDSQDDVSLRANFFLSVICFAKGSGQICSYNFVISFQAAVNYFAYLNRKLILKSQIWSSHISSLLKEKHCLGGTCYIHHQGWRALHALCVMLVFLFGLLFSHEDRVSIILKNICTLSPDCMMWYSRRQKELFLILTKFTSF